MNSFHDGDVYPVDVGLPTSPLKIPNAPHLTELSSTILNHYNTCSSFFEMLPKLYLQAHPHQVAHHPTLSEPQQIPQLTLREICYKIEQV